MREEESLLKIAMLSVAYEHRQQLNQEHISEELIKEMASEIASLSHRLSTITEARIQSLNIDIGGILDEECR
jgi:hypothetical protein